MDSSGAHPPITSRKIASSCFLYNKNRRRGICNVSKVSCHISCAIQIMCAIPTVHFALLRIVVEEEERIRNEGKKFHHDLDSFSSSPSLLLQELVGFIRGGKQQNDDYHDDDDDDANNIYDTNQDNNKSKAGSLFPSPWNPRRLYIYLQQGNVGTSIALDSNQVGDATTSLSGLLQLLSKEGGSAWKNILNASIWEGEIRQVLEGRRPISDTFATKLDTITPFVANRKYPNNRRENNDNESDENTEIILPQRRFLQRIKTSAKNKSMASPLVLKFRYTNCDSSHQQQQQQQYKDDSSRTGWSIIKALNEIIQPQIIQGTSYPWETLSPDSYSEREVICRDSFHHKKCNGNDDDDNNDNIEWITTKRIEIQRIPRVWLLHLDRPRFSVKRFRRSLSDHCISSVRQAQVREEVDLEEQDLSSSSFFKFEHVDVALTLNMSLFEEEEEATDNVCSNGELFHRQNLPLLSSPTNLVIQGAILQVVEIDNDDYGDSEEDWEGGHSITLLRNEKSWLLIDDDICQPIPESHAILMMGGVVRIEDRTRGREKDYTYFAASLLVYSIPEDNTQYDEEWKQHEDKVLSSWKENKIATIANDQDRNTTTVTKDSRLILVGKRLRVKWGKGKYYSGIVTLYNPSTGKHRVAYDDGEVKEYVLAKKTIEWINEDNPL